MLEVIYVDNGHMDPSKGSNRDSSLRFMSIQVLQIILMEESWLLCIVCLPGVFLVSCDGSVALPRDAMGLSAVCDYGISWSY